MTTPTDHTATGEAVIDADHAPGRTPVPDYMETYEAHWKDIVENEDGTLNKDKVARELHDALVLQGHLSEIYCEVSDNRVSKPFTLPSVVISMYHDSLTEAAGEAIDELIAGFQQAEQAPFKSTAEVVALIRELSGPARASDRYGRPLSPHASGRGPHPRPGHGRSGRDPNRKGDRDGQGQRPGLERQVLRRAHQGHGRRDRKSGGHPAGRRRRQGQVI